MEKNKTPHWGLRFFGLYFLFLIIYILYLFFYVGVRISPVPDIQSNYGQYLFTIQDKMVERSLEFAALVEDTERVYTDLEKQKITEELTKQNELLKELQEFSPDSSNEDYVPVYNDILKIFGFYIQGEIMQANYITSYKTEYLPDEEASGKVIRMETYTMGVSLCNMMGNMMLNNYTYINNVRNSNFESKFTITPVDDLENYLTENNTVENSDENVPEYKTRIK